MNPVMKENILMSWSGGKDSAMSLHELQNNGNYRIAALLTTFYVANYKRHVRQSETTVKVYVAKKDIPQGTPGTALIAQGLVAGINAAAPLAPTGLAAAGVRGAIPAVAGRQV